MRVAIYDKKTCGLTCVQNFPEMDVQSVRQMVLTLQVENLADGGDEANSILVAWEDSPSDYLGVFFLGDASPADLSQGAMDNIPRLARAIN